MVTVFEYRYNSIEYGVLCSILCDIVCYDSWYNMDNGVNWIYCCGKCGLPKNAICVMRSVLQYNF